MCQQEKKRMIGRTAWINKFFNQPVHTIPEEDGNA
ncbi:MAG: hypothetical protein JWQ27_1969 [Ferruginibacter sp.]|nr:hypothetical protein [Ferruginibacter sp.]